MREDFSRRRELSRRDVLKGLGAAALVGLSTAESAELPHEYLPSPLDQEKLEKERTETIDTLISAFWRQPEVRQHIATSIFGVKADRSLVREKMQEESRMFLPRAEEIADIVARTNEAMRELSSQISDRKYGLLIDGDRQNLYVIQRVDGRRMQFIKGYVVSTSNVWNDETDSRGTPLGLHKAAARNVGLFGQLVSSAERGGRDFAVLPILRGGKRHSALFVKGLESNGDAVAELVTASVLLTGPSTPSTRGIFIHGTNRTDRLGKTGSGGCIRTSNVDIADLQRYIDTGRLQKDERTVIGGTPIMITGTVHANMPRSGHPARWSPSQEPIDGSPKESAPLSSSPPKKERPLPKRWDPTAE